MAGEALAARYLAEAGYVIVARNPRCRWGELDVVARQGPTWVFVEVKTRRSERYGAGAEAVTHAKQHKLIRMAEIYLSRAGVTDEPVRFDVIEVLWRGAAPRVRHLVGAFEA